MHAIGERNRHVKIDIIPIERDDVIECEYQKQDVANVSTNMINGERSNELRRGKHARSELLQDKQSCDDSDTEDLK